jgi:hypothetical protein
MAVAYPFIEVAVKPPPAPVAQRSPGVVAVVGKSDAGSAAINEPHSIYTADDAETLFGANTPLTNSLELAMSQNPRPSGIYGVKVTDDYAAGLAALEAVDDVSFVSLANETAVGTANPATALLALKKHAEDMTNQGSPRIGVAMVDPAIAKSNTYAADVIAAVGALKSDSSGMIMVAARGANGDAASAVMAAIAGYEPHISVVLKQVREISMPKASQYSPSEIVDLSKAGIIPVIDPTLIPGEGLHLAEGQLFTNDAHIPYIDLARTLFDIQFRLKAGLIGEIGDARITKEGLTSLKARVEGILGPLKRRAVIDDFSCVIEALNILNLPQSTWAPTDKQIVETARATRTVEVFASITYGPAVHTLKLTLETNY